MCVACVGGGGGGGATETVKHFVNETLANIN